MAARPVVWIGSSLEDLRTFPDGARDIIGRGLYAAQLGEKAPTAKPLQGFGGASVLEIVAKTAGDTYRAVYAVEFENAVYVLHCFQKKSKKGVKTPQHDLQLIKTRLKLAEGHSSGEEDGIAAKTKRPTG